MSSPRPLLRRLLGGIASVAVVGAGLLVPPALGAQPAYADSQPADADPPTVTTDVLPTVQIDGVVWDTVIVGDTVYATGEFTKARPAGAAAGTGVTRSNLLAFRLSTGDLLDSWAPSLNAQGLALAASEDGKTIFVGGQFTQANGENRYRLAALDATTGALRPSTNIGTDAKIRSMAVVGDTLYVGGIFGVAGNQPRTRLAAYDTSTLTLLPWAPSANAEVTAMTAPQGTNTIVVGGRFSTLNGNSNLGLGALDASTGATRTFAANSVIKDYGTNAAIWGLQSSGSKVIGSGYNFGGGNFEGVFLADGATGALDWMSACYGDSYDAAPLGDVVYTVNHAHDCSSIGGFPEQNPRTWQRAVAYRLTPNGNTNQLAAFRGRPAPRMLHFEPDMPAGTYTGQSQAGWTVSTSDKYLVMGGEFEFVNGVKQQGLVRMATHDVAPNKSGPLGAADMTPTGLSLGAGTVRVSWKAAFDHDNNRLTYELLRGSNAATATVVGSTVANSGWLNRQSIGITDTTAPGGTTQTYRVRVRDADGNTAVGPAANISVPAGTATAGAYANLVRADGAFRYWRMGETSGSAARSWTGASDLSLSGAYQRNVAGAITGDPDKATTFEVPTGWFPGAPGSAAAQTAVTSTPIVSLEAWFTTRSTKGGPILGYGNSSSGNSSAQDRLLYMSNSGQLVFGVWPGVNRTVTSPNRYNDGAWHHAVATLGASGMKLYVDGQQVAADANTTAAESRAAGYWRVGSDQPNSSWPSRPTNTSFDGSLDEVAVYQQELTAAQVAEHKRVGGGGVPNQAPTAAFTETFTNLDGTFDASTSTDPDGTIASYAWTFGDGQTGTGVTATHTYATAGERTVTLTVTDDKGATATTSKLVTPLASNQAPAAAFTATPTNLSVAFDGQASTDADGTIASYAWDFGDGQTGTGATATHVYAAAGTYPATLTVTDDRGGTNTVTHDVTVSPAAAGTALAEDAFERTVASGFGTADVGGAWTKTGGGLTASVESGTGKATITAGQTGILRLGDVANRDNEVTHSIALDALPTGAVIASTTARSTAAGDYRARVRIDAAGLVQLSLSRSVGYTDNVLTPTVTVPGLTYTAGAKLMVKTQAVGASPTTVQAKVWLDGTPEPAAWQITITDATAALQTQGAVGLASYLSAASTAPVTIRYDDFVAKTL